MRALVAFLVVGCGSSFGTIHKLGPHKAAVQTHAARPLEVVTFVAPFDATARRQMGAQHALLLSNNDWVASLGAVVMLSPSGDPRWSQPLDGRAAVEIPGGVAVVERLQDRTAVQTQTITAFGRDGRAMWSVQPKAAIGYTARALRAAGNTIIATERGVAGIDDKGGLLWDTPHKSDGVLAASITDDAIVVATSDNTISSREVVDGVKRKDLCHVRILDAKTGEVRASVDIAPEAHRCTSWGLSLTNRAIALRIADVRHIYDGKTMSQSSEDRVLVLDPQTLATTTSITIKAPAVAAAPTELGADEAIFLDGYATGSETLGLLVVDVARREARKAVIFTPAPQHSYIQLMSVDVTRSQITFAGQFVGAIRMPGGSSIRSDQREVDSCDAAGGIECSRGRDTTTVSPVAGVIGAIRFTRK